jgi:hypothetical protein
MLRHAAASDALLLVLKDATTIATVSSGVPTSRRRRRRKEILHEHSKILEKEILVLGRSLCADPSHVTWNKANGVAVGLGFKNRKVFAPSLSRSLNAVLEVFVYKGCQRRAIRRFACTCHTSLSTMAGSIQGCWDKTCPEDKTRRW